jgi:hypothetical protein
MSAEKEDVTIQRDYRACMQHQTRTFHPLMCVCVRACVCVCVTLDPAKCGDILVQCKVAHFEDLVLDFSLTHPRTGSSTLHPVGSWKPDALANLTQSKTRKHAIIPYEQANHAFLSLTADTYGKLSDDFVRCLWMLATSASTNSRLSQPSSQDFADPSPDSFAAQVGSSFSRIRVRVEAAVAKAAAARFMPDSADDGLPSLFFRTSQQPLNLPLPMISLCTTNRVSVSHVFLHVGACSVTTSVLFCLCLCSCPSVYFPMSLSCIL